MGFRIGSGIAIIKNQAIGKYQLCLVEDEAFVSVSTFENDDDACEIFSRISEIQGISKEEAEVLELYKGTSETMRKSITEILRVTQEDRDGEK